MKKKTSLFAVMTISALLGGMTCCAQIIPSQGPGQIGLSSVVLCDSISLHQDPDFDSPKLQTLEYGDRPIVMSEENGWAQCVLGDAEDSPSGWLDADFIAIDPAWYQTEEDTVVYAWNDTDAPKIAFLDPGTELPILRDDGDWIIVSLRGAVGWINDTGMSAPDASSDSQSGDDSGSDSGSGSDSRSIVASITVYDENGTAFTLYEDTNGMWWDDYGTEYVEVSATDFQVYEGTRRVSTIDPSQGGGGGSVSMTVYDENGQAYTLYEGTDGIWRDNSGTEYVQLSETEFQVKEGTKRLSA